MDVRVKCGCRVASLHKKNNRILLSSSLHSGLFGSSSSHLQRFFYILRKLLDIIKKS